MATKITKSRVEKLQRAYKSAVSRAKRMKEQSESIAGQIQGAALVSGSAFAIGYAQHRFRDDEGNPGIEVLGIPLDLGLGLGLHLGSIFGIFGNYSESANHVANGALAAYATTMGAGLGTKAYDESSAGGGALPDGAAASGISNQDLRDLAAY